MTKHKRLRQYWRTGLRSAFLALAAGVAAALPLAPAQAAEFTVHKSPWCGCCGNWIKHLEANGHSVVTKDTEDLDALKKLAGVPEPLQSCHTAMVEGYVIEGHVPAKDIERLLAERPKATGLAAPGMPSGSPGMEGGTPEKYDVLLFQSDGSTSIYARH